MDTSSGEAARGGASDVNAASDGAEVGVTETTKVGTT